jgi:hypothetical protein
MFRPLASLLVVIPLALANSAFAEETSDGAAAAPAPATETGATPAGAQVIAESAEWRRPRRRSRPRKAHSLPRTTVFRRRNVPVTSSFTP